MFDQANNAVWPGYAKQATASHARHSALNQHSTANTWLLLLQAAVSKLLLRLAACKPVWKQQAQADK